MINHTPEPWYASFNDVFWEFGPHRAKIGDTCASSACAPDYGHSLELGEANAKRLCSCVNALAGIANPAEFVESHAELVAACDAIRLMWLYEHGSMDAGAELANLIRDDTIAGETLAGQVLRIAQAALTRARKATEQP